MDYRRTVPFEGDAGKALEAARTILAQSGYRITRRTENEVVAEHAGSFTKTHSGGTMYGASPLGIAIDNGNLTLRASFAGVEKLRSFLVKLLLGLGLFLGLSFFALFSLVFEEKWPALLGLLFGFGVPIIQLPIHLFLTPRITRQRAVAALDTLAHNLPVMGR